MHLMLVWTILTNAPNPLELTTFTKKMGEWAIWICIFMRPFWVVSHIILNDLWTWVFACSLRIPKARFCRPEPGWSTLKSRNIETWILGTKRQQKLTIFHLAASPNGPCGPAVLCDVCPVPPVPPSVVSRCFREAFQKARAWWWESFSQTDRETNGTNADVTKTHIFDYMVCK